MASVSRWLHSAVGRLSAGQAIAMFTFINILNYLDRGIVPGAFESIGEFIRQDLNTEDTDVQIGLLQSMYIVGYAVASVTFGHLVHTYPPFHLMSIGLAIWVLAVVLSGWAPHFWVLVLARVFSGVGEASFQTVVPPYIDDNAPPAKRGLWLSLFFMAIPVGTAVGYAWGGNVATSLSWRWAFFLEAIPMLPLVFIVWFIPYKHGKHEHHEHGHHDLGASGRSGAVRSALTEELGLGLEGPHAHSAAGAGVAVERTADGGLVVGVTPSRMSFARQQQQQGQDSMASPSGRPIIAAPRTPGGPAAVSSGDQPSGIDVDAELALALGDEHSELGGGGDDGSDGLMPGKPTFLQELVAVLTEPVYMSIVLGYAGYTAVLAGMGSFGPTITKGLGLFSDQSSASLYFGAAVSIAGAIGTPLGGYMIDWSTKRKKRKETEKAAAEAVGAETVQAAIAAGMPEEEVRRAAAKQVLDSPGAVSPRTAAATGAAGLDEVPAARAAGATAAADEEQEENNDDPAVADAKMVIALPQAVWATAFGTVACMGGMMVGGTSGGLFFTLLGMGALALCTTTAGINQSIMAAVRPESRSFAIGIGTLLLHALGDVPAPPIIGALADKLSPQTCTPSAVSAAGGAGFSSRGLEGLPGVLLGRPGVVGLARALAATLYKAAETVPPAPAALAFPAEPAAADAVFDSASSSMPLPLSDAPAPGTCTRDAYGLQVTLVITLSWLIWPILLWGAAWALVHRRMVKRKKAEEEMLAAGGEGGSGQPVVVSGRYGLAGRRSGSEDEVEGATALLSADRTARATLARAPGSPIPMPITGGKAGGRGGRGTGTATPPRDWNGRMLPGADGRGPSGSTGNHVELGDM